MQQSVSKSNVIPNRWWFHGTYSWDRGSTTITGVFLIHLPSYTQHVACPTISRIPTQQPNHRRLASYRYVIQTNSSSVSHVLARHADMNEPLPPQNPIITAFSYGEEGGWVKYMMTFEHKKFALTFRGNLTFSSLFRSLQAERGRSVGRKGRYAQEKRGYSHDLTRVECLCISQSRVMWPIRVLPLTKQ